MVAETSAAVTFSLPVGYHFSPSDEEIVEYYLKKKLRGETLPYDVIPDCDLYGDKAPWEIFPRDAGTGRDRFFVFTRLKRLSKKRVSRTASTGEWHGNTSGAPIFDGKNNVVGARKQFVFKVKKGKQGSGSAPVGHWIMHEYSLAGVDSDCVLCEIENKEKKRVRVDDEGVLSEMVNQESKRLRMDGEEGFLTATVDADLSSSSWLEIVNQLTSEEQAVESGGLSCGDPCNTLAVSTKDSEEEIVSSLQSSIDNLMAELTSEVQAVESGGLSCRDPCNTHAVATDYSDEEIVSSPQSSITNSMTSSSSSLIPVGLASEFDGCHLVEVENSGENGFVDLPEDQFWVDNQLAFLTSCGASDFTNLPMSDCDDDWCNLLDFDTNGELGMTGLW